MDYGGRYLPLIFFPFMHPSFHPFSSFTSSTSLFLCTTSFSSPAPTRFVLLLPLFLHCLSFSLPHFLFPLLSPSLLSITAPFFSRTISSIPFLPPHLTLLLFSFYSHLSYLSSHPCILTSFSLLPCTLHSFPFLLHHLHPLKPQLPLISYITSFSFPILPLFFNCFLFSFTIAFLSLASLISSLPLSP